MAITQQQDTYLADLIYLSSQVVDLKAKLENIHARGNLNNFLGPAGIQDADLALSGSYKHLTQDKIFAADTAMQAILTTLGDPFTDGTNLARLAKMKG